MGDCLLLDCCSDGDGLLLDRCSDGDRLLLDHRRDGDYLSLDCQFDRGLLAPGLPFWWGLPAPGPQYDPIHQIHLGWGMWSQAMIAGHLHRSELSNVLEAGSHYWSAQRMTSHRV